MKKVRFESQVRTLQINRMNDSECHSPRPFVEKQVKMMPVLNCSDYLPNRSVPFTSDPIQRFEYGNSSPYPVVNKTHLSNTSNLLNRGSPSNELDLSMLDCTYSEPRSALPRQKMLYSNKINRLHSNFQTNPSRENNSARVLAPIENQISNPPNVLNKADNFFLRRDNLSDLKKVHSQLNNLHLDKENNPQLKKTEIMKLGVTAQSTSQKIDTECKHLCNPPVEINRICQCHHCVYVYNTKQTGEVVKEQNGPGNNYNVFHCVETQPISYTHCPCNYSPINNCIPVCDCSKSSTASIPQNAVDKKNWTIEKYEKSKQSECLDVEKQKNLTKEIREPTVADLFKIIKLQNEQLQQLQEKVDKFILSQNSKSETHSITQPIKNYVTEHVEVKTIERDEKISIGVMTSFEMHRTSTIINKEIVKQSEAQIQCNRSQISIKEVVSKSQPANLNFLDGIAPVTNQTEAQINKTRELDIKNLTRNTDNIDKTLNEMSLYNVQVNTDTPQMSPEQSLYLDVRDYSDSDASSDDQSNVGWTYYNKIMTHVNGMLQESDMPSSASAMYRNGRQKCLQMQIDKTNVSVAKRVTFGDDPLALREQPHLQAPTTDTSLKMNQLAAKYLKNVSQTSKTPSPKPQAMPVDMSLATRNYMEKHKLLHGNQNARQQMEIPKFLDITALKQQPKFL